jgi:hypothetical protein
LRAILRFSVTAVKSTEGPAKRCESTGKLVTQAHPSVHAFSSRN